MRPAPAATSEAEHRLREEHVLDPLLSHDLGERIHARLRQRRLERRVVATYTFVAPKRPACSASPETPEPSTTACASPSEAALASTPSEPVSELAAVVLEEDERRHSSRFSSR